MHLDIKHMTDLELAAAQDALHDAMTEQEDWLEEEDEPDSRVCIAQYRCPQRHVLLALATECTFSLHEWKLDCDLQKEMHKKHATHCPICHAPRDTWRLSIRRTRYRTMAEAMPALQRLAKKIVL